MPEEVLALLFNHIDPIYEHHTVLLKDVEHRLAAWFDPCFLSFDFYVYFFFPSRVSVQLIQSTSFLFCLFVCLLISLSFREGRVNGPNKGDVHKIGDLLLKMTSKVEVIIAIAGLTLARNSSAISFF